MQIISSISEKLCNDTVVCIGNFDGVHLVHQKIINKVVKDAKELSCSSLVITFKQHTISVLRPEKNIRLLMSLEEKNKILKDMGVDYLLLCDFNEIKTLTAERFLENLVTNFNMKKFVCGYNFKFGYKNRGNVQFLKQIENKYQYFVDVLEPFKILNKKVSSTKIRTYIKFGEIEKANEFLGRFFSIEDVVIKGKQLGRKFGFPTANIKFNSYFCIPQNGVYATLTEFEGNKLISMTNIGYNPTFKNKYISIETHILDFNKDIYGKRIKINFIKKLRNEVLFSDVHSLSDQLREDRNNTYEIVKKYLK